MFSSCATRKCIFITIIDDSVHEANESFFLSLERTPVLERVAVDPSLAEVLILNDDGEQ